ncbi:MAG: molybdate ABC transporter substrate-binding protein [Steroidobacteraceae bacterium]
MLGKSLLPLVLLFAAASGHAAERIVTVFAASSLTDVLEQVGKAYTASTRIPVRFSFAASSALARQIESGSPADVFVSADQEWMDYLASRKLIKGETRNNIVSNSLVLVAPADSKISLRIGPGFGLATALGKNGRLATGDPASVPVGKYASAALTRLGVWDAIKDRLIPADNVRTALNFVALGEAPLGIVYATDARGNGKVRVVDTFPAASHDRISYPAAVTTSATAEAASFMEFLGSQVARNIFDAAGFGMP